METIIKHDCTRCGHSPDWHSLDDALNLSPTDASAPFSCNGPGFAGCAVACPDFQGQPITIVGE